MPERTHGRCSPATARNRCRRGCAPSWRRSPSPAPCRSTSVAPGSGWAQPKRRKSLARLTSITGLTLTVLELYSAASCCAEARQPVAAAALADIVLVAIDWHVSASAPLSGETDAAPTGTRTPCFGSAPPGAAVSSQRLHGGVDGLGEGGGIGREICCRPGSWRRWPGCPPTGSRWTRQRPRCSR